MTEADIEYIPTKDLYCTIGYSHRQSFWRAFPKLVKRGLPFRRVHDRRVIFYRKEFEDWWDTQKRNAPSSFG
jgi:hypothetical protein